MTSGMMAVDCELRLDFPRLRQDRLDKAKQSLKKSGLGAFVCFDQDSIRYITSSDIGPWGRDKMMRFCILPRDEDPILFEIGTRVDFQLRPNGAPWLKGRVKPAISWGRGAVPQEVGSVHKCAAQIKDTLAEYGLEKEPIGFDMMDVLLMKALEQIGIQIEDGHTPLLEARKIKTAEEIELLNMAAMMVDAAYYDVAKSIRPGIREVDLVGIAHKSLYSLGADWVDNINCVSGPRTNPHPHDFTDRVIRPGDIVFLDIQNVFCGYRTCYYRTFCCGKPNEEQKELYAKCLKWLSESIDVVKPGATTADIASKWPGPEVLGKKSELEVLACQWGHGLGVSLWEYPIISRAWSLDYPQTIEENMVFALETFSNGPAGCEYAIRIEEEIVVTKDGHRLITKFPTDELLACPI